MKKVLCSVIFFVSLLHSSPPFGPEVTFIFNHSDLLEVSVYFVDSAGAHAPFRLKRGDRVSFEFSGDIHSVVINGQAKLVRANRNEYVTLEIWGSANNFKIQNIWQHGPVVLMEKMY